MMLSTASAIDALWVIGFVTAMLIVTSSLAVGTVSLDQLPAVSQSPPWGLIHEIEESTNRFSSTSSQGR